MLKMNADALRRAIADTRAGKLLDATALIQQTLGQHELLARGNARPTPDKVPRPARSGRETYFCAAGSCEYVLHLPAAASNGVLLMLHGCTQTPEDFAIGTDIVDTALAQGLVVVLPAQSRGNNAQSCWNWFSGADQTRGRGEPAMLAGLTAEIAKTNGVSGGRIFVAGLSAGGAMAVILGETYPEIFAGVAVHSGLPYGCARGVNEAFAAMAGTAHRARRKPDRSASPTIVFHGTADHTVAPSNSAQIIADVLDGTTGQQTQIVANGHAGGRDFTQTTTLRADSTPLAEHWQIEGLGHAWSGGNPKGSHTDARGPDASAEILRFFQSLSHDEV